STSYDNQKVGKASLDFPSRKKSVNDIGVVSYHQPLQVILDKGNPVGTCNSGLTIIVPAKQR
ncbi:MAG: hypothetical protein ACPHL6_10665, partial [Rubripirellula sp.]